VLARFGQAVIVMGDRAVPLPYILIEGLPGFSSLSLLYRLALGPALAVALLAAVGVAGRSHRVVGAVIVVMLLEGRVLSPLGHLPDTVDARVAPAIHALAEAPDGAVMNFPVVGGRKYLYEQTVHRKPVAGSLNFPNNLAAQRVWRTMLEVVDEEPAEFRSHVGSVAKSVGIRYLVVHVDAMARPDMHDRAVVMVKQSMDLLGGEEALGVSPVRVYALW